MKRNTATLSISQLTLTATPLSVSHAVPGKTRSAPHHLARRPVVRSSRTSPRPPPHSGVAMKARSVLLLLASGAQAAGVSPNAQMICQSDPVQTIRTQTIRAQATRTLPSVLKTQIYREHGVTSRQTSRQSGDQANDRPPSANDRALIKAAQTLILAAPEMVALRGAVLSRAEVNGGLAETAGYLYLRYDVPGAVPQEFWAYWGKKNHLNFHSGQVSVGRSTQGQ